MSRGIILSICTTICLVIYIILGFGFEENNFGWITFWPLLFLPNVFASIYSCIKGKTFIKFDITSLALFTYLFIGMLTEIWHPTWVIMFAVPLFYSSIWPFEQLINKKYLY